MAEDGHHCLFMEEKAINAWEMQAPMLIILVFNTFFLVWVISVCWNYYNNSNKLSTNPTKVTALIKFSQMQERKKNM